MKGGYAHELQTLIENNLSCYKLGNACSSRSADKLLQMPKEANIILIKQDIQKEKEQYKRGFEMRVWVVAQLWVKKDMAFTCSHKFCCLG